MSNQEERLEKIKQKVRETEDSIPKAIFSGCGVIALAIILSGCIGLGGSGIGQSAARGTWGDRQYVVLSNDRPLEIRLVDDAGRAIKFE